MRLLSCLLLPVLCWAQAQARREVVVKPGTARCHVYAVETQGAARLMQLYQEGKLTVDQVKAQAGKIEQNFPAFDAPIAEEQPVTRTFDLPGTALKITATLMFSDETMAAESVWLGLVVGPAPVENALNAPDASIAEVNFGKDTFKLLTKTRRVVDGQVWVIGAECQFISDKEWRERVNAKPAAPRQ